MSNQKIFRVWNIAAKSWVMDDTGTHVATFGLINNLHEIFGNGDGLVIQQWTGAKDKTGKYVYEGDIINIEEHSLYHSHINVHKRKIVYWDTPNCAFCAYDPKIQGLFSICGQEIAIEVIGNMFEVEFVDDCIYHILRKN
jgi:hypothetical protein